jgi:DNA (cytosine-5)-methyltransferase 1
VPTFDRPALPGVKDQPRLRTVSLFSGAGGLDAGFIEAGFEPIWANDIDPVAVETYRRNIGAHAVAGDLTKLVDSLPAAEECDVVIGGPPCQGFSVAGHMRPDDPRSKHVFSFMDIVDTLEPRSFVMENVKALAVNRRFAEVLSELRRRADELGYETELLIVNAAHYGVPQARERMFLIGIQGARVRMPSPVSADCPLTVADALRSLPPLGAHGNDQRCTARITPAKKPVLRRSPYAGMLFNGQGRPLNLGAPALTLPATMGGNRTPIIDQLHLEGGPDWVVQYHARLWSGKPPFRRVPKRLRRLTVQEAAALQTFPPGWEFAGRQSARFRQIGNAVPPKLAFHVATAVLQALSRTERDAPFKLDTDRSEDLDKAA